MSRTEDGFCGDRNDGLFCDMPADHKDYRHCERGVADWLRGGQDIRDFVGYTLRGRPVYRRDAPVSPKGHDAKTPAAL